MNAFIKTLLRSLTRAARPHLKFAGLLQTSGIFDRSALVWTPGAERVLVLAPHMDDEVIGCGGTIALHARQGAAITIVFMTDGRNGGGGIGALSGQARELKQVELAETRKREAGMALATLGISDMRCLEICDGQLGEQAVLAAQRLRSILLEVRPDLVYVPFFVEEHPDHRATSAVLLQAVEATSLDFHCVGYEVWTPLFPNCLVDISITAALKWQALAQYRSQLQDGDYLHATTGLNAYRSIALHGGRASYAEAFCVCRLTAYRTMFAEFMSARTGSKRAQSAQMPEKRSTQPA